MNTQGKPLWMVFKEQKEKERLMEEARAATPEVRPEPLPIVKHEPPPKPASRKRGVAQEQASTMKRAKKAPKEKPVKEKVVKVPKPDWTVASHVYESKKRTAAPIKNALAHLRYKRKRVHTLRGPLAKEILEKEAARLNQNKVGLEGSNTYRLYMDMSDEERLALASKHSPELFPS